MNAANKHSRTSFTLLQATQASPTLSRLADLAQDSKARLQAIESLLPNAMRQAIQPGPVDGTDWCLLVSNNAVAAKLRQLSPALLAHLRSKGWEVNSIRLKVQTRTDMTRP